MITGTLQDLHTVYVHYYDVEKALLELLFKSKRCTAFVREDSFSRRASCTKILPCMDRLRSKSKWWFVFWLMYICTHDLIEYVSQLLWTKSFKNAKAVFTTITINTTCLIQLDECNIHAWKLGIAYFGSQHKLSTSFGGHQDLILTTIQLRQRKIPIQIEVDIRPK